MTLLLAIDPGPTESAWVLYDLQTGRLDSWAKEPNANVVELIAGLEGWECEHLALEQVASYGMAVGETVFETVHWAGRFHQAWLDGGGSEPVRVKRLEVKMALCHNARANDSNIRQALIDRFGPGKDRAIGRKASPGPLYGLSKDGWAALGVAVTAAPRIAQEAVA